jgi:hypothetical protein
MGLWSSGEFTCFPAVALTTLETLWHIGYMVHTTDLNKTELSLKEKQEIFAFVNLLWSVDAPLAR